MDGTHQLAARLLYSTGLRINEALRLRVKGLDFGQRAICVRSGKGDKDRVVTLPEVLAPDLRRQLGEIRETWQRDVANGKAGVERPHAMPRQYRRARFAQSARLT